MFQFNIRKQLQDGKSVKAEYIEAITSQNYWALFFPAIFCTIIEFINLIRIFFYSSGLTTLNNRIYFYFYLSLLLFTFVIMILQEFDKKNTTYLYYVQLTSVIFYLIWNACFNWYQIFRGHQTTLLVFMTAFMGSLVLIHLRLEHSLIIILASCIFIVITSGTYMQFNQISNLLISVMVALLIVITYYVQKVNNIIYQKEIAQVNQMLKREQEQLRISSEKQMNQRILDQMEGTKSYFTHLKATQEKVLLYHHDMRHTLRLIEQFIAQEDMDAIKSHAILAQEKLESIAPKLYCEHNIINLILGSFEQMASHEAVTFTSHVQLPKTLPFTSLTLCTLYFNLLENALFATSDVTDSSLRQVEICSYINNHKLVINIKNGYAGTVAFEDGLPRPSISRKGHGLGIQSIVDTVDTCGGMYLFKTEGQLFIAQILLPLDD